jgi:hypothetical protein
MMDDWFINIACTRWVPQRRLNQFVPEIVTISPAATNGIGHEGTAAHIPSDLILVRRARPGAYFICRHQGGSHAEWPKDSHEHAPTQTCGVIFCPPKAVDTECRPNPVERASKRPKKLRAISGASPGGSPVGECRRGGELLPTCRTLFQVDVLEPRSDVENVAAIPDAATHANLLRNSAFLIKFDEVAPPAGSLPESISKPNPFSSMRPRPGP